MNGVNQERRMLEYLDRVLGVEETVPPATSADSKLSVSTPTAAPPEAMRLGVLNGADFPLVSRHTTIVAQPVPLRASLAMKKLDLTDHLVLTRPTVITRLPIGIFCPPILQPERPSPLTIRGGDLYLVPDESNAVIYYVRGTPRLLTFSAQIDLDSNGRTVGGSATLLVALQAASDPLDPELQGDGVKAVQAAGYPALSWSFRRLSLAQVTPILELPSGHEAAAQRATGNAETGTATFLLSLTPLAAQIWRQAFVEGSFALPGVCRLSSIYTAQNRRAIPSTNVLTHTCSLQALAKQAGPGALRVTNAEQAVNTTLVVDADPVIENVVVEMQATSGSASTETFGPAGGRLSVTVTSPNLAQEQVRWSATVSYGMSSWPPIRTGGVMSGSNGWSTLIVPSSWRREVRFTAILLDSAGNVLREAERTSDRVTGSLDFTADFLVGETGLQNSFETQSQIIVTTLLPQPPGSPPGKLKLTVFALRNGRDEMKVREIAHDEQWVVARVYANGRIEIVTNRTPGSESARQPEVVRVLHALSPQAPPAIAPRVSAELKADRGGLGFRVWSGQNPFWALQAASRPELLLPEQAWARTAANYYSSLDGARLDLRTGEHWQIPESSWRRLLPARVLYYRLWTSADATRWRDPETTIADALVAEAPSVIW